MNYKLPVVSGIICPLHIFLGKWNWESHMAIIETKKTFDT